MEAKRLDEIRGSAPTDEAVAPAEERAVPNAEEPATPDEEAAALAEVLPEEAAMPTAAVDNIKKDADH